MSDMRSNRQVVQVQQVQKVQHVQGHQQVQGAASAASSGSLAPATGWAMALLCAALLGACSSSTGVPVVEPVSAASTAVGSETTAAAAEAVPVVAETMSGFRRLDLPDLTIERPLPFTVQVPETWDALRAIPAPGVWIGPLGSQPEVSPDMLFVRRSKADLSVPLATLQNIRTASERADDWKAADLRVVKVGGVEGVLVRMVRGEGEEGRSTFVLKLPLDSGSVDIMAISSNQQFDEYSELYEKIFFSVEPIVDMPPPVNPS